MNRTQIAVFAVLLSVPAQAQLDITPKVPPPKSATPNSGNQMGLLAKKVRRCLDDQVPPIAMKPLDLETASLAAMVRCSSDLDRMRDFILRGIPNFQPSPDYWEKEIEPAWLKEAKKKIALFRSLMKNPPTAEAPAPPAPPKPKLPPRTTKPSGQQI